MKTRVKLLALAAALTLFAMACGDNDGGPAAAPPTSAPAPAATDVPADSATPDTAAPAPASDLPSVEIVDVYTGDTANLASFAPSDRPIVLWFWAPH